MPGEHQLADDRSRAIQVSWAAPSHPNGVITHYTLYYQVHTLLSLDNHLVIQILFSYYITTSKK